ncbi:MAG: histidine phosphatase family protein [Oscillospiraceae bacterium]|nr:histidine phosphatase family protein [Oscillospiraceae bacterium]MDE7294912.1 histidine phosphatase family protein [Oscillospiraceae bacterium]
MKGYRLCILRHGRTKANEEGIYIGKTDYPLSEEGKRQLKEIYESHEYPKVEKVYSSPLERAVQSAEILFPDREITEVDDLREVDFGVFEGLRAEELINLDSYKKWLKGGLDNPPPNGESLRNMMVRCYTALNGIILDMMHEDITSAGIMTHSGILMNMMSCFGLPKYKPMEFACPVGHGYEVLVTAQMWQQGYAFEILGKVPDYSAVGYNDAGEALFEYDEDYSGD